jgi:hypothetical protein
VYVYASSCTRLKDAKHAPITTDRRHRSFVFILMRHAF